MQISVHMKSDVGNALVSNMILVEYDQNRFINIETIFNVPIKIPFLAQSKTKENPERRS